MWCVVVMCVVVERESIWRGNKKQEVKSGREERADFLHCF